MFPVLPGTLQSAFGGNSGSAYMLLYHRKQTSAIDKVEVPKYWLPEIAKLNESYAQARAHYDDLKNQLDVIV